ncbi:50S ribosomal protein L9 [Acetobacteraceae bacterium EV16G]|uniref:Large ribosomal subunit protein bL9 n=1 Tax=Sorlinia euscelidii TaxID=3081148 RepID=A0ABU7U3E5_9PROT
MSQIELILLERVAHLGQMGDVVRVKPGYARNFLLPKGKALRANETNRKRFETDRAQLEALNLKKREEAERLAERMDGLAVVIIRQAGDSGSLYGSVTSRDIAEAITVSGLTVERTQVVLPHPIKLLGLVAVQVVLHPEVTISVTVNVARSEEEAERQAKGEVIGPDHDDVEEPEVHAEEGEVVAEAEATEEVSDVSES